MKHLFCLAICLFLFAVASSAQVGVRAFHFRPTGEFGFVMKPITSLELSLMQRFSRRTTKKWRTGFTLTYFNFKPRLEVFPIVGVLMDGNGTTIIPGVQYFEKYKIFQLCGGMDYAFVHKPKLNVFAGADLVAGSAVVDYASIQPTIKNETYSGGGILVGARGRLGAEYNITKAFSVYASIQRQIGLVSEPRSFIGGNDYGIGVRYSR